jgi:hypothetical protein
MNLLIRFEDRSGALERMLVDDGWHYRWGCYQHPEVKDEQAARMRLSRLGLLTSGRLQVDFLRPRFLFPFS